MLLFQSIYYSHARDLYGRGQPQGTCVLLQIIRNNDILEGREVQIEDIQNRMVSQNSVNETTNFNLSNLSCPVALYSLCYPIMKPCNYWNYNSSLPTIVDNGKKRCRKSNLEHNQLSPANFPRTVDVWN